MMTLENMSWTRANNAKIRKSQSDDRHKSLNEPNQSLLCEFLIFKYMKFCVKVIILCLAKGRTWAFLWLLPFGLRCIL